MIEQIFSLGTEQIVDDYFNYDFDLLSNYIFKKGDIIQSIDYFFYCSGFSSRLTDMKTISAFKSINISASKNIISDFNITLINECFRPGTRLEIIENHRIMDYSDLSDFEKNYISPYKKKMDRLKKMERIIYG